MLACGAPKVEEEVETAEKLCPIDVGRVGKITDVSQSDTIVVFTFKVDDDSVALDSTFRQSQKAESFLNTILQGKKKKVRRLLSAMVASQKGLRFNYIGSKSGESVQATISGLRLTKIVDKDGASIPHPDRKIRLAVTDSVGKILSDVRKELPRKLRDGLLLEQVKVEGGYIVYTFTLDGMGLSLERVKNHPEAVKSELVKLLPGLSWMKNYSKEGCLGLILRFYKKKTSQSNGRPKSEAILLTPTELDKLKL